MPQHEQALRALEEQALPRTPQEIEADRRSPALERKLRQLEDAEGRVRFLERLLAFRENAAVPKAAPVRDYSELPPDSGYLNELAWPLVDPKRSVFGREEEGLALARRAVEVAGSEPSAELLDTLAWALFWNGLEEEAKKASAKALAVASAWRYYKFRGMRDLLDERIAQVSGEEWPEETRRELGLLKGKIAALEEESRARFTWRFDADETAFRHEVVSELVSGIPRLFAEKVMPRFR